MTVGIFWTNDMKMKGIVIPFVLLVVLAAGCTPAPPGQAPVPARSPATRETPAPVSPTTPALTPSHTVPPALEPGPLVPSPQPETPAPTPAPPVLPYDGPIIDAHSQFCPENLEKVISLMNQGGVTTTILSPGVTSPRGVITPEELVSFATNYPGRIIPAVRTKARRDEDFYGLLEKQMKMDGYGAMAEVLMYHSQKGNRAPETVFYPGDNRVQTALNYALDRKWPFVVHIEFAAAECPRDKFITGLKTMLTKYPEHPFVLIHMGQLDHADVRQLIEEHDNIYFITSSSTPIYAMNAYNDHWTNMFDDGHLSADWKQLIIDHPDRFVLGFDMVWVEQWGNFYLGQIALWRKALGELPPEVAHAFAHSNAERLWHLLPSPPKTSTQTAEMPAVPAITPLHPTRSIAAAGVWLFAVDDGNPQLALSAESDGKLLIGRWDVIYPNTAVSWQTVAGPADTGGVSIADHWHIFAHGYHWLVFSVAGDSASYLLKLDKDFQRLALVPVGHTDGPTNDMFLVAEPNGVAVAHFAPGYGHTIHRFNVQANKTGQVRIGGGAFTHANGSSAIPVEGGYLLFSSETLNPSATSAVKLIQLDASWRPVNVRVVLDDDGTNAVMPSAVRLDSGYTIVHLRIRTGVSPRQKAPPAPQPGSPLSDDSGTLMRLVLAPDGTIVSRKTLVSDGANRPHTTLVGDLLITTWDETGAVRLRVDRIQ